MFLFVQTCVFMVQCRHFKLFLPSLYLVFHQQLCIIYVQHSLGSKERIEHKYCTLDRLLGKPTLAGNRAAPILTGGNQWLMMGWHSDILIQWGIVCYIYSVNRQLNLEVCSRNAPHLSNKLYGEWETLFHTLLLNIFSLDRDVI